MELKKIDCRLTVFKVASCIIERSGHGICSCNKR